MRSLRALAVATAIALFCGAAAQAGPITSITITNCDNMGCEGTSLSLSVEDMGNDTYIVTQSINSTGFNEVRLGMNQVGFKAIKDWTAVALMSASGGAWNDPVEANNSSNNLCQKGTKSDKVCTSGFVDITTDDTYEWVYEVTGGTIIDTAEWHWGGQFANEEGRTQGKIISAVIPEPNAAIVFGLGTVIVGGAVRRRSH